VHLAGDSWPYRHWPSLQSRNIDALLNVLEACVAGAVKRFVFPSSLLTMDGHQDGEGPLDVSVEAWPLSYYAVTKLVGESLCRSFSERHGLTTVCLRLGMTRRGENPPMRGTEWEQQRWLGNTDMCRAMEMAVTADIAGHVVVPVVSANQGMRWRLDETTRILGYVPQECSQPRPLPLKARVKAWGKKQTRLVFARLGDR